ncbi:MAG: hypothetical protein M3Q95_12530, partial [Bacteroidota bacterium]|nr:hypothetical protein [Bacteroidota bacterium]
GELTATKYGYKYFSLLNFSREDIHIGVLFSRKVDKHFIARLVLDYKTGVNPALIQVVCLGKVARILHRRQKGIQVQQTLLIAYTGLVFKDCLQSRII